MELLRKGTFLGKWFANKKVLFQFCRNLSTVNFLSNSVTGDREVVGHGKNGSYTYLDHPLYPFPAIRFRETSPEILCLREKEKGDWRNLTIDEKKTLYRASFCQTYAEMNAPNGEWKQIIGVGCMIVSIGLWVYILLHHFCYVELPDSFTAESKEEQLKRMLLIGVNQITGLSSKWDYNKQRWK